MTGSLFLDLWSPRLLSVLRIVAGIMYTLAGTMKILAFPAGMPPNGGTAEFLTQVWIGGMLELICGGLLTIGLFTRTSAFLMSGQMAVAYWQFHAPQNIYPTINGGVAAILYCFLWLYFAVAGAGPWSIDTMINHKKTASEKI